MKAEIRILETLLNWKYPMDGGKPGKAFNIAFETKVSISHTYLVLRYLAERGLVEKSPMGHWYVKNREKAVRWLKDVKS